MKKLLISSFLFLILFSGCGKRGRQKGIDAVYSAPAQVKTEVEQEDKKVKKLFVDEGEDLESLILEDEQVLDEQGYPVLQLKEEVSESWADHSNKKNKLTTIYFDFGSSVIRSDQRKALDENVKKTRELVKNGKKITIEGHACKYAGSREYNMALSHDRAQVVADYLVNKGIPAKALKIVGRGFEMCLVEEDSMEAQAVNRRVEFYVED